MESPKPVAASNQTAQNRRNKAQLPSSTKRIEEITRREALNHVDSAWMAHRHLMHRCLELKFGKNTDYHKRQRLDSKDDMNQPEVDVQINSASISNNRLMDDTNDADHNNDSKSQSNNGRHSQEGGQKMQSHSELIRQHAESADRCGGDRVQEIEKSSSYTQDVEKGSSSESNRILRSAQSDGSECGSPMEQGKKRRKPTVAEQSTRNIILQHFIGLQGKKRYNSKS